MTAELPGAWLDAAIESWSSRRQCSRRVYDEIERSAELGRPLREGEALPKPTPPPSRLGRFERDEIASAKDVSIVDVAERLGLDLSHHNGDEWLAHCPLHDDEKPSLWLNDARALGSVIRAAEAAM